MKLAAMLLHACFTVLLVARAAQGALSAVDLQQETVELQKVQLPHEILLQPFPSAQHMAYNLQRYFLFQGNPINEGNPPQIDLTFVIQTSTSLGFPGFKAFIRFAKDLVRYFSISTSNTRVAVVTFASGVKTEFRYDAYHNRECLLKAMDRIRYYGGQSVPGSALYTTYSLMHNTRYGARRNSKKLVFFMSNHYKTGGYDLYGAALRLHRSRNTKFYALGLGSYTGNMLQLNRLGTTWSSRQFYHIPNIYYLPTIIQKCTFIPFADKCCFSRSRIVYDECNRRCTCRRGRMTNCCRVRKEFSSMSCAERSLYLTTFKTLTTQEPHRTAYRALAQLHRDIFSTGIHQKTQFLPWHRWYILELENLLRAIDCRVTVPYWAWSLWAHDPWGSNSIWGVGPSGLGGSSNGGCVPNGLFSQAQGGWSLPDGTCLRRSHVGSPPNEVAITASLAITDFTDYELNLRGNLHDNVHCLIGGTMCTSNAATAPEFFLHHGYVDKLWNDWQQKSTANMYTYFHNIPGFMQSTPYRRRDFLNIANQPGCVRVCYDEPEINDARRVRLALKSMPMAQLVTISQASTTLRSSETQNLFKLSDAELARSKTLQNIVIGQTQTRTSEFKSLSVSSGDLNSILGFKTPLSTESSLRVASLSNVIIDTDEAMEIEWQKFRNETAEDVAAMK